MKRLWDCDSPDEWQAALNDYEAVIDRQEVRRLPVLDRWYRDDFPSLIASRNPAFIVLEEVVKVTEWKMARGVWRARNLALVRGNQPEQVKKLSAEALAEAPDPTAPISTLSRLAGVGPATASAVMAAANPETYPFFDELVAAQIPKLGDIAFTLGYYARYARALRERAERLDSSLTAAHLERALWANSGGKAGITV
jgi:hypothetical protein